jgi:hypothetical protein
MGQRISTPTRYPVAKYCKVTKNGVNGLPLLGPGFVLCSSGNSPLSGDPYILELQDLLAYACTNARYIQPLHAEAPAQQFWALRSVIQWTYSWLDLFLLCSNKYYIAKRHCTTSMMNRTVAIAQHNDTRIQGRMPESNKCTNPKHNSDNLFQYENTMFSRKCTQNEYARLKSQNPTGR